MSEDSENHINQKGAINLAEGKQVEMFSMSLDNAKCKQECVSLKEKHECAAMNMKKSIEMQVAQKN